VKVGDRILSANGTTLEGLEHDRIVEVMLSSVGQTVLELQSDTGYLEDDSFRKTVSECASCRGVCLLVFSAPDCICASGDSE
jgi:hypothetical protein